LWSGKGSLTAFFFQLFERKLLSLDFFPQLAAVTLEALDLLGTGLGGQGAGSKLNLKSIEPRLHVSCPEAEVSTYPTEFDGSQD
jgi:hypothetical protein